MMSISKFSLRTWVYCSSTGQLPMIQLPRCITSAPFSFNRLAFEIIFSDFPLSHPPQVSKPTNSTLSYFSNCPVLFINAGKQFHPAQFSLWELHLMIPIFLTIFSIPLKLQALAKNDDAILIVFSVV